MANKFFTEIGTLLKKVFSPTAIKVEAGIADIILPGFSPLINSAATAIITAEGAATVAGLQNGTGTQKMAYAVSLFQSTYNQWASQNGLTQEPVAVQNVLQQVFNLLSALQPVTAATVAPTPVVTPAVPSVQTQVATSSLI